MKLTIKSGCVSKFHGYRNAYYEINGIEVEFYLSHYFSTMKHVNRGNYNILLISFSAKSGNLSYEIIDYCLSYFGFDKTKEYYVNTKTHCDYSDYSLYKTIYYEQLTKRQI